MWENYKNVNKKKSKETASSDFDNKTKINQSLTNNKLFELLRNIFKSEIII